jgi:hypothetical protein
MRLLRLLMIAVVVLPLELWGETMDVNISNPRVEADSFKFEVQIKRTDNWIGFGEIGGLGNCDFYFNNNSAAFTGDPTLSSIHAEITGHSADYELIVQILLGQLQVKLTYNKVSYVWNPPLDTYEDLCTVQWKIGNSSLSSGVSWDGINSGFNDGDGEEITPTYYGSGDISLPVQLASFTASTVGEGVELKWITESEINNLGFEVHRSVEEKGTYTLLLGYEQDPSLLGQGNSNTRHEYSFQDKSVVPGQTYWYKLADVDMNGNRTYHGPVSALVTLSSEDITSVSADIPTSFKLHQNYPNPFNPSTKIRVDVPRVKEGQLRTSLVIYNALGQVVRELYAGNISPGSFEVVWDGRTNGGTPVPSGIYFAIFRAESYQETIRLILLK